MRNGGKQITEKQLTTLENKRKAFNLSWSSMGKPKTQSAARYEFKRLDSLIAQIKMGFDSGEQDSIDYNGDENHIFDEDYLDPIY